MRDASHARRKAKAGASRRYGREDTALFEPHVLMELDGLRAILLDEKSARVRATLMLVLSALLTKVSRKPGDTASRDQEKRIARGFATRFFFSKTEELARALSDATKLFLATPRAIVRFGDARKLEGVASGTVDAIVTSPPYPGNYDYLLHHEARLRWLNLRSTELASNELGARRHLQRLRPEEARRAWIEQLSAVLKAISRVLRESGKCALVIADSVVARTPISAPKSVEDASRGTGLRVVGMASQARPHFDRGSMSAFSHAQRQEHVILLERTSASLDDATPRRRLIPPMQR